MIPIGSKTESVRRKLSTISSSEKIVRLYKSSSTMYKHFEMRMAKKWPKHHMSYLAQQANGRFSTQMSLKDKFLKPVPYFKIHNMRY